MRGKKSSIQDNENYVLDCEYELKISYENEKDLEKQIDEIVKGIDSQVDTRNCFTKISVRALDESDKYWY